MAKNPSSPTPLRGIVYLGEYYFIARIIENQLIFSYDGKQNNGQPVLDSSVKSLHDLTTCNNKHAAFYFFTLDT